MPEEWIEIEDTFLTDESRCTYWLFGYECARRPRSIKRKRVMRTLDGDNLDAQLEALVDSPNVILIASPAAPLRYAKSNAEPVRISIHPSERGTSERERSK